MTSYKKDEQKPTTTNIYVICMTVSFTSMYFFSMHLASNERLRSLTDYKCLKQAYNYLSLQMKLEVITIDNKWNWNCGSKIAMMHVLRL